jgi:hypothetical protein
MAAVAQGWAVAGPAIVLEPHGAHEPAIATNESNATTFVETKHMHPAGQQEAIGFALCVLTHRGVSGPSQQSLRH